MQYFRMKICDSLNRNIQQTHFEQADRLEDSYQVILLLKWQCGFKCNLPI